MKIYTDPNGNDYTKIPNPYKTADGWKSPYTWKQAQEDGWTVREEATKECTKYQLVKVLKAEYEELYEKLYSAYQTMPEVAWFWNTVISLDRTEVMFKSIQQLLGIDDATVLEVFAKTELLPNDEN